MPKAAPAAPPQPPPPPAPPEPSSNQPVHAIRHRNLKASVWRNQTETGPMYNVTVTRSYREGDAWHDSHSFGYDDLMNVAKLLYDAHSFITAERSREASRNQGGTRPRDRGA